MRRKFIRQLRKNLREVLKEFDEGIKVTGKWDVLEVETSNDESIITKQITERLTCTPGIASILKVDRHPLCEMEEIFQLTLKAYGEFIIGKTFAVRCKRSGKHQFRSVDVEQYVGRGLKKHLKTAGVKLKKPDVTVALEIKDECLYIIRERVKGLGGYPLGCQDAVLSLISGGFDSSVSSFLSIKRGLQTHYCFFNLGGKAHELAVKEVALFLWMKYHSSHRVKFVSVPFEGVVEEILDQVEDSQMGVVLKRMMLRAGELIADDLSIKALVTGESVAQVSSQTLSNLAVIDTAIDSLVLRPLCTVNKQDIIDISRDIGTEDFSKNIPEYCAVISKKPKTKANIEKVKSEESRFNFDVLESAVESAHFQLITEVIDDFNDAAIEVDVKNTISNGSVVIDIRHPSELEISPLNISDGAEVLHVPFYQLRTRFTELDRDTQYMLYCDKGMMSRLHAADLFDEGYTNVVVLELKAGV